MSETTIKTNQILGPQESGAEVNAVGDARHITDEIQDLVKGKLPICVDFDGTMVPHHYPHIIGENKPCVEVLKKWSANGVGIILDTMRGGKELEDAVKWCREQGIELYGISKEPKQHTWTTSTKAYGVFSVDDRNLGVPLKYLSNERPMVDWEEIDRRYTPFILKLAERYK